MYQLAWRFLPGAVSMKGKEMERQRPPLIIDPLSKTARIDQVFNWVQTQVSGEDRPRQLSMRVVRTALTRHERNRLLQLINQCLGERYGFTAKWSGSRKGRLVLRLVAKIAKN